MLDELVAVVAVDLVNAAVEVAVEPHREGEVHAHDAEREPADVAVVLVAGEVGEKMSPTPSSGRNVSQREDVLEEPGGRARQLGVDAHRGGLVDRALFDSTTMWP